MRLTVLLAAAVIAGAASVAHAAEPATGAISYPPSFFAEVGPTTALDMVMRLPGFTFDKGVVVRGLEGSGGNVLVDGAAPVAKNDTLDEILKRIPAGSVARIDVIRGGAPGIDMQGRTVVANVVRKQAAGFHGAGSVSSQLLSDHRVLNAVRAEGQWRWNGKLAELSMVLGKGPDDQLGDGPRVRTAADGTVLIRSTVDADAQGLRKWLIGAYETPFEGGRLRLNGAYMANPYSAEIMDRLSLPAGREYEYDTQDKLQAELGARWARGFGPTSVEMVLFQQWNNNDTKARFTSAAVNRDFELDKKVTETVGRGNVRRRMSDRLTLEAYAEGALNSLDSQTRFVQNQVTVRLPAANVRVEEKRGEVSVAAIWRPLPTLTTEVGVKEETSTITSTGDVALEKSLSFTKPRATLTWAPNPANQVRARVEREVSQLNFDDFIASSSLVNTGALLAGNPDLSPQQAWVVEAAYERRFWKSGAVVVTARHSELTDVIDRAPVYGPGHVALADAPANIGDGRKDELILNLAVPLERLGLASAQLKGQGTWRWSEVTDPVTGRNREISNLHPLDWEAHYTQDLPKLKANWGVDVYSAVRERAFRLSEIETKKVDTWLLVFIEAKPRPDLILRAEFQNLSSRDVNRIREVYAGPRGAAPLAYVDARNLEYGQSVLFKIRKIL
ncbi:TonB-dependent receptor plug domain-containing protein [Phenylobacterium aquaticum]|uniref:TonB-dependent receptor plug domain-containing protein n=1 Tax=Phenylobacterium aquaticum TaxID=1763816 RepID=UPI001F5D23BB|nr:TonB-dependent receptor [Phenylobacterium aquaticum]MCI3132258.1 TonB-dependent receptor [Phenylobacterium aquaticum]